MSVLFEHRLRIAGFDTRALEVDGDGPPLILLHGWSDSADTWRGVLDPLLHRGRRAVALDLPGYGSATDLALDEPIMSQLDRFVRAALIRFGDGLPAVVAGNSLGGAAALRAAEADAAPIAGIVPIAPAGLDMAGWFGVVESERILKALLASPVPVPRPVVRRAVGTVYRQIAFAKRVEPRIISSFTNHVGSTKDVGRILSSGRRLRAELRDPFRLERVECPVLVIWGERDRMVSPTGADRLVDGLPDVEVEIIEGCGHCPQIEEPARVVELLEGFCDRVSESAPVS